MAAPKAPLFHPLSRRLHILLLMNVGSFVNMYMNSNIAITINCMVNSTATALNNPILTSLNETIILESPFSNTSNGQIDEVVENQCGAQHKDGKPIVIDYGGSLVWDKSIQNFVFSGTFWGGLITCLPSIFLVQKLNPKWAIFATQANKALMNSLIPFFSLHLGYYFTFGARFMLGVSDAFTVPFYNSIITNWFPVAERSTALAIYTTGNQLAIVFGNPISAAFCQSRWGWPMVYYYAAASAVGWCIVWLIFGSNSPHECKKMTTVERIYLNENVVAKKTKEQRKSQKIPWVKMMTNHAFIAYLYCNFVITVLITFIMIYLPTYTKDVLLLSVLANGAFTSLPSVFNFLFKVMWSLLVDKLKSSHIITPTTSVKISQSLTNFGGALFFFLVVMFVDCTRPILAFVLFCSINVCFGAQISGAYTSLLSIAPQFTATMSSVGMCVNMIGKVLTPMIVGYFNTSGTVLEWNRVLLAFSCLSCSAAIVFLALGSGEVQDFAHEPKKAIIEKDEDKELIVTVRMNSLQAESMTALN
ncbi:hypothetical protein WR25_23029 [Diploscapter pachys]|uniref:Major facilitator superfamily (MFS) profile domain-containing protein n=1 Tax=Diploscapter pachys TaxID=2018661 RepID=A0A2A2KA38_9BILA|nr:hypothetical protein WR25_23029 [Diploscapter pachys]